MINKNFYRKTNDKKILHKVGKQWKVVSVALLMAIGGAAVATHANANADDTGVDATVAALNTSATANAPHNAAKVSASSSVASSSASAGPYYYSQANNGFSGYNGSAASYFDNVDKDNATVNKYRPTVNSYVQSLNAEYNPIMHSYGVKSASAKSAASNDSKLAKSYATTARNTNTFNTISSLAAKNSMDVDEYTNMVQNNEQYYSNGVVNASADVKAANDVNSLVNRLETTNFSQASLKASMAQGIASSNYNGALAVSNSVQSKYGNSFKLNTVSSVAEKLSADADVFAATGNTLGNDAHYNNLLSTGIIKTSAAVNSAVAKAVKSAVASVYSNATAKVSTAASNISKNNDLDKIANSANNNDYFINGGSNNPTLEANASADGVNLLDTTYSANYYGAVSAAVNYSMAAYFHSTANSLLGSNNTAYNNAYATSVEGSRAESSAAAKVLAAKHADDFANADVNVVNNIMSSLGNDYSDATSSAAERKASLASEYLAHGIDSVETDFGYLNYSPATSGFTSTINSYAGTNEFEAAIVSSAGNNNNGLKTLISNLAKDQTAISNASLGNVKSVSAAFASDSAALSSVASSFDNNMNRAAANNVVTNNGGSVKLSGTNDASSVASAFANSLGNYSALANNLLNDAIVQNGSMFTKDVASSASNFKNAITSAETAVSALASATNAVYTSISNGNNTAKASGLQYESTAASYSVKDNDVQYALLSAGVDLDALSNESGAISDVASAVSNANPSLMSAEGNNYKAASSVENLANNLNTATSSANSAEGAAQSASASYSAANDASVTLSSYFASSYATDADNSSEASVDENNSLAGFLQSMTGSDSAFVNADNAYNNAQYAAANDYKLGVGYAQAIYNNHAHFLDVLKNAKLHSTPNFGTKSMGDKIVGSVNKGDRLTVYGVNVSRNNTWRGVVRYYVKDNTNGKQGFITGQGDYTKAAYLPSIASTSNVEIKTLKPVNVYDQENGGKVVAKVPAGKVLENADVVYDNADEDAYGFTKVETASDDYLTANTDYVEIVNPTVNTPTNNTPSEFNFNLGNGQQMANYYNNLSQN